MSLLDTTSSATADDDPLLTEILAVGRLTVFPKDGSPSRLEGLLSRQLGEADKTLEIAWRQFVVYDAKALAQQKSFRRLQKWILWLGVGGTFLAIVATSIKLPAVVGWLHAQKLGLLPYLDEPLRSLLAASLVNPLNVVLHYLVLSVPIVTSVLLAASVRFNAGARWVFFRATAESLKREIYRYRARADSYSDQQWRKEKTSREAKLAAQLQDISSALMQTDVNKVALPPDGSAGAFSLPKAAVAEGDDGVSTLTPEQYIKFRLANQLEYYRKATGRLERTLWRYQWGILLVGAIGTFLAAIGLELWIALTTAVVSAFTVYLEHEQVENTLVKYNQAASNLANIQAWWTALTDEEQHFQTNIDTLVRYTEQTVAAEHVGWVHQMQDALARLRDEQVKVIDIGEKANGQSAQGSGGSSRLLDGSKSKDTVTSGQVATVDRSAALTVEHGSTSQTSSGQNSVEQKSAPEATGQGSVRTQNP